MLIPSVFNSLRLFMFHVFLCFPFVIWPYFCVKATFPTLITKLMILGSTLQSKYLTSDQGWKIFPGLLKYLPAILKNIMWHVLYNFRLAVMVGPLWKDASSSGSNWIFRPILATWCSNCMVSSVRGARMEYLNTPCGTPKKLSRLVLAQDRISCGREGWGHFV